MINELRIRQQQNPLVFAEYAPDARRVARCGARSGGAPRRVFDLRMYVVSEDTVPNVMRNPAFEVAYWCFGLEHTGVWMEGLGEEVLEMWTEVRDNLAQLPVNDGLYAGQQGTCGRAGT